MALTIAAVPLALPVTLAEAKAFANIDHDDDDGLVSELIEAARDHLEQITSRVFVETTFMLTLDEFPPNEIQLPRSPLSSVSSIEYDDELGAEQTLSPSQYEVDATTEHGWILPADGVWPTTFDGINAVRIRFIAGYAHPNSPEDHAARVPLRAKLAIKQLVSFWYGQREVGADSAPIEVPYSFRRLSNALRVWRV